MKRNTVSMVMETFRNMQNEVFRRLCIVVSAATGQYEYAYLADLQPV